MADARTPVLKFRNYAPRDAALAAHAAPLTAPSALATESTAATILAAPTPSDAPVLIVPKKANWDLKRDLAPKLERLSKMTQRAIGEIVAARAVAGAAAGTEAGAGAGAGTGAGAGAAAGAVAGGGCGGSSGSGGSGAPAPSAAPTGRAGVLDEVYRGAVDPALLARGREEALDDDA
jgi:hypothetical protein